MFDVKASRAAEAPGSCVCPTLPLHQEVLARSASGHHTGAPNTETRLISSKYSLLKNKQLYKLSRKTRQIKTK